MMDIPKFQAQSDLYKNILVKWKLFAGRNLGLKIKTFSSGSTFESSIYVGHTFDTCVGRRKPRPKSNKAEKPYPTASIYCGRISLKSKGEKRELRALHSSLRGLTGMHW